MNEIPDCKCSGCRLPTLVYKLSYTTILLSARAGKRQDWGHSQFTTPGSGMQTLSFPKGFCSKLGLARCHTLPVPMNFRGSTWQCAGLGSYRMKECLSICGTWIRRLCVAKQSRSRLLTSLIRSASIWLTLPNKKISIYGHRSSRNSIWYNFCTASKLYVFCRARIQAQFQFLRTTMYFSLSYAADDVFRTLIILGRKHPTKRRVLIAYIFLFFHLNSQIPAENKGTSEKIYRFYMQDSDQCPFVVIRPITKIYTWISKGTRCFISWWCFTEATWHEKKSAFCQWWWRAVFPWAVLSTGGQIWKWKCGEGMGKKQCLIIAG